MQMVYQDFNFHRNNFFKGMNNEKVYHNILHLKIHNFYSCFFFFFFFYKIHVICIKENMHKDLNLKHTYLTFILVFVNT